METTSSITAYIFGGSREFRTMSPYAYTVSKMACLQPHEYWGDLPFTVFCRGGGGGGGVAHVVRSDCD